MSTQGLTEVLRRMKQVTASSTDTGLAQALGVSPQTLSSWKARDSVPYALCIELAQAHSLSLDWLLLGEGPQLRQAQAFAWLAQLQQLALADQQAIAQAVQDRYRLRELEQQVERLQQQLAARP